MAHPIYIPRLNNNDDEVRVTDILVRAGDPVTTGQALAHVETDKANVAVDCDRAGYVLRVLAKEDMTAAVGSVLLWIGETSNEPVPGDESGGTAPSAQTQSAATPARAEPTAKARQLLAQHGLNAADVPARGARLTAEDVEAYLSSRPSKPPEPVRSPAPQPLAAGHLTPLTMEERGMLRSVLWHRDEAVPAYLEIEFDQRRWEEYAKSYAAQRRMLGDPFLPLLAQRLVTIAREHPRLNSTIVEGQRHAYEHVNLGFTIQVQESLYLVVVQEAEAKEPHAFIEALNRLHRKAIAHQLGPTDLQGATVAFSSMARWQVARHIPILPPHVSLIVAHTVSKENRAVLGATYDHRVLSGGDTVAILTRLAQPPV